MVRLLWPVRPLPDSQGEIWQWDLRTVAELPAVRAALRSRLGSIEHSPEEREALEEQLVLAFDELASNALRHGSTPVVATVVAGEDGCLLDISDRAPTASPVPAEGRDPALGGLGLHLVAHLATEHGWCVKGDRKHVWASLVARDREAAVA